MLSRIAQPPTPPVSGRRVEEERKRRAYARAQPDCPLPHRKTSTKGNPWSVQGRPLSVEQSWCRAPKAPAPPCRRDAGWNGFASGRPAGRLRLATGRSRVQDYLVVDACSVISSRRPRRTCSGGAGIVTSRTPSLKVAFA